jgi:hypothetical protein
MQVIAHFCPIKDPIFFGGLENSMLIPKFSPSSLCQQKGNSREA